MPKILRSVGGQRLVAASVALSLAAAACGGGATDDVEAQTPALTDPPSADGTTATDPPASTDSESEESVEEAATPNLFPNVDVVNVVDRTTLNLSAELGGGDLPVLLWFWAPH